MNRPSLASFAEWRRAYPLTLHQLDELIMGQPLRLQAVRQIGTGDELLIELEVTQAIYALGENWDRY